MKAKRKLAILTVTLCATTCLALGVACTDKQSYQATYYANYGEWFVLPEAESVSVVDADGQAVTLVDGSFLVRDVDGYTLTFTNGRNSTKSQLSVSAGQAPIIQAEKRMMYAAVGEKAELIGATASDSISQVTVTGKMYKGETEIDVTDGFVPETVGTYEYVLSATGGNGKTSTVTVPYYVEESEEVYQYKLSSFDKPYGVNQIGLRTGLVSYSQDVKFGNEEGSTAIEMSGFYTDLSTSCLVFDLNQADVTGYDGLYFYVYNGTSADITAWYSWGKSYLMRSREWTRLELKSPDFYYALIGAGPDVQEEDMTLENINGFNMNFSYGKNDYIRRGESIYLSAMYGLKAVQRSELQELIDTATANDTTDTLELDNIEFYFSQLTKAQKNSLEGYNELKQLRMQREVLAQGSEYVANKVAYFDDEIAFRQVSNTFGVASFAVTDEKTYNGEKTLAVKVNKVASGYRDMAFKLDKIYSYDMSSYDIVEIAVYNPTDVDLLYYVTNNDYLGIGTVNYTLKANSWTNIVTPVTSGEDIERKHIWIRPSDWADTSAVMSDKTFYFAPIYAYSYAERLHEVVVNEDFTNIAYLQSLVDAYKYVDDEAQTASKADYAVIVNKVTGLEVGDVIIDFNADGAGAKLHDEARARYSYCTDATMLESLKTAEGVEETKAGVACYELVGDNNDNTTDYFNLKVLSNDVFFSGLETLEMWVYFETQVTGAGYMYRNGGWDDVNAVNGLQTVLTANAWTKITIDLRQESSIQDWIFIFSGGTDGWGKLNTGDKLYLSALTVASVPTADSMA